MDSINKKVKDYLDRHGLPLPRVALGAVSRDGALQFANSFGGHVSENENDVYWIASATKFIVSIAVMQCVEKGLLNLDGDISTILPEWKNPVILTGFNNNDEPQFQASERPIILRHLLIHSSGMAYAFVHDLAAKYHTLKGVPLVYQKTIRDSFTIFLVSQPGEQFIYSPGIDWAGLMVEHVTGMKLSEFMRKNIFEPVSAHDVTFHLEQREDLRARRVKLWERDMADLKEVTDFWWPDPAIDDIGGGGIYTTVHDLLKIYLGVLQGKLLHSTTLKVMFSPQLKSRKGLDAPEIYNVNSRNAIYNSIPNDIPSDFGIGGLVNTEKVSGRRSEYSLTWSGMPNCYWWLDISKGIAGVYLSQLLPTGDEKAIELLTEFEKAVYSTLEE